MRRVFLAALTSAAVVLFAGCSDQESTGPAEPTFGKKPPSGCLSPVQQSLSDDIRRIYIENLFADDKTKDTAEGKINNIERKLCKDQYEDATNMAWGFLGFTSDKIPHKSTGTAEDAAELTSKVLQLAADPAATEGPLDIPAGAFLPTGGVITFDPADASAENPIIAATENGEAAVVVDNPAAFAPGTGMVTIALSREADEDVVVPGGFIPGFQAFPEGYRILSSHQPSPTGGGVIIALCVVLPAPADLVIGHLHEGSVDLLVPTDPNPEDLGYIDCADATATTGGADLAVGPKWLNYARRLVQPVAKLFEPQPLNAMFFRGRGLGGRTTSLSLDAPVDPTINVGETVQLSVGTNAAWSSNNPAVTTVVNGLVTGVGPGTDTVTADFGAESWSMEITVQAELDTRQLLFSSDRDGSLELYLMNADGSNQVRLRQGAVLDLDFEWSPDGSLISFTTFGGGDVELHVMNADGSGVVNLSAFTYWDEDPDWSPDGTLIAFEAGSETPGFVSDIVVIAPDGTGFTRLATDGRNVEPAWSPDGSQIAFSSLRVGVSNSAEIWVMNADGSAQTKLTDLSSGGFTAWRPMWSPDGTRIAFHGFNSNESQFEIYVMNADGSGLVKPDGQADDVWPLWSPDGSQIAFQSNRDGVSGVYAMNADGTGPRRLTDSPGYDFPISWSPDGSQIVFSSDRDGDFEVYIMNSADGSDVVNLTDNPAYENSGYWRP